MFGPPIAPDDRSAFVQSSRESVLVGYALVAAVPLVLWIASRPLAGVLVVASLAGLVVGTRRVLRLTRCFHDCGGFSFDLGGSVRITVAHAGVEDGG